MQYIHSLIQRNILIKDKSMKSLHLKWTIRDVMYLKTEHIMTLMGSSLHNLDWGQLFRYF